MKAIRQHGYGAPASVLQLEEVDKPQVGDDQVLVRVRASSVNSGDWRQVRASPVIIRFVLGLRGPKDPAIGGDVAGIVEAVGRNVTHLTVGDEAFGIRSGAFAEYVSGKSMVAKPANLTFEEAAAVPIAALTALQAVRDKAGVVAGSKLLVNGAGGGVGHFAVQVAKALGAEVTAVTSTDKLELARSIGADHVIDRTQTDFTKSGERYDAIVDVAGDKGFGACRRVLTADGTLAIVGSYRGTLLRLLFGSLRRRLLRQRIVFFLAKPNLDDLMTLKTMVEAGQLRPHIDRRFSLEQAAEAVGYSEKQNVAGKVVLTMPA